MPTATSGAWRTSEIALAERGGGREAMATTVTEEGAGGARSRRRRRRRQEEGGCQEDDGSEEEDGCRRSRQPGKKVRRGSYGTESPSLWIPPGLTKPWKSRWFAERDYDKLLLEDVKLKAELNDKLKAAGVSSVEIERPGNKLRVLIRTARPGIIIGRKGAEIDKLKHELQKRTKRDVYIDIQEVHKPELDAQLVSETLRCNWKSASASAARCARRWTRRCASAARESRCG